MYDKIKIIINRINRICYDCTPAKKTKLLSLAEKLQKIIDPNNDCSKYDIDRIIKECQDNLKDPQFTYKQISLFGLFKSRSENVTHDLLMELNNRRIEFYLDKLRQYINKPEINAFIECMLIRNFSEANKYFQSWVNLDSPKECLRYLDDFLKIRIQTQMEIPAKSYLYSKVRDPLFELNSNQRIYYIEELRTMSRDLSRDKTLSLTYSIDRFKNVLFSIDADNSFHINHCKGRPVYGAGEAFLKRTNENTIALTELNNKSGLYVPRKNHLDWLSQWFRKWGFNTTHTELIDYRELMQRQIYQVHIAYR